MSLVTKEIENIFSRAGLDPTSIEIANCRSINFTIKSNDLIEYWVTVKSAREIVGCPQIMGDFFGRFFAFQLYSYVSCVHHFWKLGKILLRKKVRMILVRHFFFAWRDFFLRILYSKYLCTPGWKSAKYLVRIRIRPDLLYTVQNSMLLL